MRQGPNPIKLKPFYYVILQLLGNTFVTQQSFSLTFSQAFYRKVIFIKYFVFY